MIQISRHEDRTKKILNLNNLREIRLKNIIQSLRDCRAITNYLTHMSVEHKRKRAGRKKYSERSENFLNLTKNISQQIQKAE